MKGRVIVKKWSRQGVKSEKYYISIPNQEARARGLQHDDSLLLLVSRIEPVDYVDWSKAPSYLWDTLSQQDKLRACLAGNGPVDKCRDTSFLVLAVDQETIRRLQEAGIDPNKPVTLRMIADAIRRHGSRT